MSDQLITVVGSIVKESPELRFTSTGTAICEFGVRVPGSKKEGTEATFRNIVCWRELAENVAESLSQGDRVIIQGVPKTDTWTDKDGVEKSRDKVTAYAVGVDLNYATAEVVRLERKQQVADDPKPAYADF